MLSAFTFATAQTSESDKILGLYHTEGKTGKVNITKQGDKYVGILVWTSTPNALDKNNPDPEKRNNKLEGTVILRNFGYDGKLTWTGGTAYDPKSGKTYKGKITLNEDGSLNMRGYVGIPAFGRTAVWTRVK